MKLFFLNGPRKGENIALTPPGISIGREEDNDVQLLIPGVSRYHAKLTFDGTSWKLRDLGSTNGTKVNGTPISGESMLNEGDTLGIGDQVLIFGTRPPKRERKAVPAAAEPEKNPVHIPAPGKISAETLFGSRNKKESKNGRCLRVPPGDVHSGVRNPVLPAECLRKPFVSVRPCSV